MVCLLIRYIDALGKFIVLIISKWHSKARIRASFESCTFAPRVTLALQAVWHKSGDFELCRIPGPHWCWETVSRAIVKGAGDAFPQCNIKCGTAKYIRWLLPPELISRVWGPPIRMIRMCWFYSKFWTRTETVWTFWTFDVLLICVRPVFFAKCNSEFICLIRVFCHFYKQQVYLF